MTTFNAKVSIFNKRNKHKKHIKIEDGLKADRPPRGKTYTTSSIFPRPAYVAPSNSLIMHTPLLKVTL